ncbi:hypothetical protein RRG08_012217 [Elysia crispata]|uniref:Uncharacterized protein n=1 Tax=Elysia crispata TaxID=231223 RepID=A0AAE1DBL5_9GAST|nr:hypothetical protein RRG08_012217 [Elysia crispata]
MPYQRRFGGGGMYRFMERIIWVSSPADLDIIMAFAKFGSRVVKSMTRTWMPNLNKFIVLCGVNSLIPTF